MLLTDWLARLSRDLRSLPPSLWAARLGGRAAAPAVIPEWSGGPDDVRRRRRGHPKRHRGLRPECERCWGSRQRLA